MISVVQAHNRILNTYGGGLFGTRETVPVPEKTRCNPQISDEGHTILKIQWVLGTHLEIYGLPTRQ